MVEPGNGETERNNSQGDNNAISRSDGNDDGDVDLLWSLRKYLVLLGILAVSVTYTSGLTPPGGFWSNNQDGHKAGDPVLLVEFAERHAVFFHCNSTAFAASLILLILLLSKRLTREKVWLRSMQVIMIVDLFSLMGAYAAGSCRALKSSIYILVLVLAVSIYMCIHVVLASKWFPMFRGYQKKEMEEAHKFILMLVTFSATVTYQAGLSPPGGFWAENDYLSGSSPPYKNRPATSVLRSHNLHRYNIFISCNSTSFVASLVTILLLLSPTLSNHGIQSKAVAVCVLVNLCCLIGAYAAGCCRDATTSFYVIAIIIIVLISIAFLVEIFASSLVAEKLQKIKSYTKRIMGRLSSSRHGGSTILTNTQHEDLAAPTQEGASERRMLRLRSSKHGGGTSSRSLEHEGIGAPAQDSASELEHRIACNQQLSRNSQGESSGECPHVDEEKGTNAAATSDIASNNSQGNQEQIERHLKKTRTCLLLLAILAASLTYQSGLNPPGGFWSTSKNNHLAGDRILEDNNHPRFIAFFYLNAGAFVASLVMIVVLLNKIMIEKVAKRRELQICMIVDLLSLTWSFIMGSCRETNKSVFISVLVCLVLFIFICHVVAHACLSKKRPHSLVTCKKVQKDMDQRRSLILTLAILAATVTYQAGMNPPGGVWSDDRVNGQPGYPILQDTHPVRYGVFYYSNSVSFVSSVVITILLLNKESFENGIKFYALHICLVMGLLALLIAYGAGSCRNWNESLFLIIVAVLVLISLVIQLLLFDVHETSVTLGRPHTQPQQPVTHGSPKDPSGHEEKNKRKRHKYLMLIAILAASVTYQAGLNPPGGFWSVDEGHVAGNPLLHDTYYHNRYMVFFSFNAFSFMASIVVIMLLLSRSFRNKEVQLEVLLLIMILDLLGLMTAFAVGSCRKVTTSIYVFVLVAAVVMYLVVSIGLSKHVEECLRKCKSTGRILSGRNIAIE